jgi:hypothetical protein
MSLMCFVESSYPTLSEASRTNFLGKPGKLILRSSDFASRGLLLYSAVTAEVEATSKQLGR